MDPTTIKDLHGEMQRVWNELKQTLETSRASDAIKVKALQNKLDELETKLARPLIMPAVASQVNDGLDDEAQRVAEAAYVKGFRQYARKGTAIAAEIVAAAPGMTKDMATDSDPDGGYWVPVTRRARVIELLREISPVRELANIETISVGNTLEISKEGATDFDAGWIGERVTPTATASATTAAESIPTHEQYAKPKVTQRTLDDAAFDVEAWLNRRVARKLGELEAIALVKGSGVGQPEGVMTNADIAVVNSGDAALLTADGVIKLFYALPEPYARNATWLMKRATVQAIRLFKDTTNQYLWQPGLAASQPATILGQPYREAVDMDAVAANNFPIVFGDFRAGYTIVDRLGIRVLRDPYSSKPFIEFYTTRRVGGQVVLAEAFKKQKVAA